MAHQTHDYLQSVQRYPKQAWERTERMLARADKPGKPSAGQIACIAAIAVSVAGAYFFGSELLRYMKMRQM